MKKVLTKSFALCSIALLMLASCKKNDPVITTSGGKPGTLSANATTLPLDKSKINDTTTVIKFAFTKPAYEFKAAVTNTLQIDPAGDNWAKPMSVTLGTNVLSQGYSTAAFNALLLKLSLPTGVASQVKVRIEHSIGEGAAPTYSNELTLTVTPFNLAAWIYVVGQFNGYSTTAPDSLLSATSNGIFTGIINFPVGQPRFLILPAKSFATKWATNATPATNTASMSYAVSLLSSGGSDLYSPTVGGQYLVTLNTNTNAITLDPANYYSVIGDGAKGWDPGDDVAMKYINDGTSAWSVTTPLVSTGMIKIRQNNDWAFSWGIPKAGEAGAGVAATLNDTKNDNIPVPANGTYKVSFTIPTTAVGTTPAVLATYTLVKQ